MARVSWGRLGVPASDLVFVRTYVVTDVKFNECPVELSINIQPDEYKLKTEIKSTIILKQILKYVND